MTFLRSKISPYLLCYLVALSILFFSFRSDNQKLNFLDISFNKAFHLSKKQNRLLFIYVSSEHCDQCDKMKTSFIDQEVISFYNANFLAIKLDPDNFRNNLRASEWGVHQTPSFVFINNKKQVVYTATGYQRPEGLLKLAGEAMGKAKELEAVPTKPVKKK